MMTDNDTPATPLRQFAAALRDPAAPLTLPTVEELLRDYPYFTLPAALLLARDGASLDPDTRTRLEARVAISVPDRDALRRLVTPDGRRFDSFYPDEQPSPPLSTDEAITTFISNYGQADPHEEALLERLIFNPTPDYAQLLAREEERSIPEPVDLADADSRDALINAFILKSRQDAGTRRAASPDADAKSETAADTTAGPAENSHVQQPQETADDTLLSESLAKIYIRQRRYTKAYEIIRNLSLNYPEKSIYFADQLRFLQKLIINQQHNK